MFQTSYRGIVTLHNNKTYAGGFCKFFYIPVEDIDVFPRIDAATQWLKEEPSLKTGKHWYGPIRVPKDKFGYNEVLKTTKAGHYYETKVTGLHTGESADSRINYENLPFHRYILAAKVRAGGFYVLIGTDLSFCKFIPSFSSGDGPGDNSATEFNFQTENIHKALIMPSFSADTSAPGDGGNGEEDGECMNQKEIISFEDVATINIPWTSTRQGKFGNFPIIEVYVQEPGQDPVLNIGGSISADNPPPAFTELTVQPGGSASGFIVIS